MLYGRIIIMKTLLLILIFIANLATASQDHSYHVQSRDAHLIHIIKLKPNHYDIALVQASDKNSGLETLDNLADKNKATIAINAGFFKIDNNGKATATGVLKRDGQWISGSNIPRGAIGWRNNLTLFDNLATLEKSNSYSAEPLNSASAQWTKMTNIVGGCPLLVSKGKIITDHTKEKSSKNGFIDSAHARTAIGVTKDGHWIIVVAEQRYAIDEAIVSLDALQA